MLTDFPVASAWEGGDLAMSNHSDEFMRRLVMQYLLALWRSRNNPLPKGR